jgi:hypothetical protein
MDVLVGDETGADSLHSVGDSMAAGDGVGQGGEGAHVGGAAGVNGSGDVAGGVAANGAGNRGVDGARSALDTGGEGVTVPASKKPNPGRWLPGQSGNPAGRQIRKYDRAYLSAIAETIPPEKMPELLNAALDVAHSKGSWRGYLEIARFVAEYQIGKPVQRIHSVSSKMDSILTRLESIQIVDGSALDAGDEETDTDG